MREEMREDVGDRSGIRSFDYCNIMSFYARVADGLSAKTLFAVARTCPKSGVLAGYSRRKPFAIDRINSQVFAPQWGMKWGNGPPARSASRQIEGGSRRRESGLA